MVQDNAPQHTTPRNSEVPTGSLHHYRQEGVLGKGTFGTVIRARDTRPGRGEALVAIKLLPRGEFVKNFRTYVKREIEHQGLLKHPFIVTLKEVFLTETHLAIVMEYAPGGNLFMYVLTHKPHRLHEEKARWIFQQLIIGLEFCHRRGVANRDLKLENLLLDRDTSVEKSRPLLKICDFGYSKHETNSSAKSSVGTYNYMAPEIIHGGNRYDAKKADLWSCGVILYALVYGRFPFSARDRNYAQNIVQARYALPEEVPVSDTCKHLVQRLLVARPDSRISLDEIKQHPWFLHNLPDDALAMNDWYIQFEPNLSEWMETIDNIIEQATRPGLAGERLPAVVLP